jgi:uncharacterized protein YbjT (DUF2867 family)
MAKRTYALLGASGLVGAELQKLLAADPAYERGVLLSRRVLGMAAPGVADVAVEFDQPESFRERLAVDDVFCCLGTTMKKAGSQAAFRKVDLEIPVAVGREARAAGARQYLIVTAVGADATSGIFYNRVKGEAEAALAALGFPGGLKVFRPSMLLGDRAERRPLERAGVALFAATRPLFAGGLTKYRAIDASAVARAMVKAATAAPENGDASGTRSIESVTVYEGKRLFELASPLSPAG